MTAPEFRTCPVTGRVVVFAPERLARPVPAPVASRPDGRPCPLCPGMEHDTPREVHAVRDAGTVPDGPGWSLRVVPNKFPSVRPLRAGEHPSPDGVPGFGAHELVVDTARHDPDPAGMTPAEWTAVVLAYRDRVRAHGADPRVACVAVFKNVGAEAGASLEHPHSQVVALPVVPDTVAAEWAGAARFHARTGRCVFCDMLDGDAPRVVVRTERFATVCPVAPRFAYETWVLPAGHAAHFEAVTDADAAGLAGVLCDLVRRVRRVLPGGAFNLYLHTGPPRGGHNPAYHWRFVLAPRTSKPAGFEWATGCFVNPVPPELAAERLRDA